MNVFGGGNDLEELGSVGELTEVRELPIAHVPDVDNWEIQPAVGVRAENAASGSQSFTSNPSVTILGR